MIICMNRGDQKHMRAVRIRAFPVSLVLYSNHGVLVTALSFDIFSKQWMLSLSKIPGRCYRLHWMKFWTRIIQDWVSRSFIEMLTRWFCTSVETSSTRVCKSSSATICEIRYVWLLQPIAMLFPSDLSTGRKLNRRKLLGYPQTILGWSHNGNDYDSRYSYVHGQGLCPRPRKPRHCVQSRSSNLPRAHHRQPTD